MFSTFRPRCFAWRTNSMRRKSRQRPAISDEVRQSCKAIRNNIQEHNKRIREEEKNIPRLLSEDLKEMRRFLRNVLLACEYVLGKRELTTNKQKFHELKSKAKTELQIIKNKGPRWQQLKSEKPTDVREAIAGKSFEEWKIWMTECMAERKQEACDGIDPEIRVAVEKLVWRKKDQTIQKHLETAAKQAWQDFNRLERSLPGKCDSSHMAYFALRLGRCYEMIWNTLLFYKPTEAGLKSVATSRPKDNGQRDERVRQNVASLIEKRGVSLTSACNHISKKYGLTTRSILRIVKAGKTRQETAT